MSKLFLLCLYFTSFTPLWLAILYIDIKSILKNISNCEIEKISIVFIIVLFVIALIVLNIELRMTNNESMKYKLISAKENKTMISDYLLSYVLPLFAFDFTEFDSIVIFLIFYFTLGFLCIRHNYFGANIILEIMGYRFYDCKIESVDKKKYFQTIISNQQLTGCLGEMISLKSLNNECKLNCGKKK